jgi:hypothetical protein
MLKTILMRNLLTVKFQFTNAKPNHVVRICDLRHVGVVNFSEELWKLHARV